MAGPEPLGGPRAPRLPTPRRAVALALSLVVPLAVAAAWIPARAHLSNIDIALALVLSVMLVGTTGWWPAAVLASASAAWWFDFFDTKPYAQPTIASRPDLVTFLVLAAVGAATGTVTALASSRRRADRIGDEDLVRLRRAAGLLATGSELVAVISAIAAQIGSSLGSEDCCFDAEPADPARGRVERDGTLAGGVPVDAGESWTVLLPVWAQGVVIGHFVLRGRDRLPARDRWLAALALADQAGAALAAYGTIPPPDQPDAVPRLRLLGGRERAPALAAPSSSSAGRTMSRLFRRTA